MDLFEAAVERDRAIAQVSSNAGRWIDIAMAELPAALVGEFTGEDVKHRLLNAGVPAPHHHNAWGALMMRAAKAGLIEKTGVWVNTVGRAAHARMAPLYRRK